MGDFDGLRRRDALNFVPKYASVKDILASHELAALGDALVNFIFSLAQSIRKGTSIGFKVKGIFLADALEKAGLRAYLPGRITRHQKADAAESLILYAWARGIITLEEAVEILCKEDDAAEAFKNLLKKILSRLPL